MTPPDPALTAINSDPAGRTSAYRMAGLLGVMGVLHFVVPKGFDSSIPAELPGSARFYTYASGVGELATAGLLAAPATRKLGAGAAVALYLAVFPANLNMVRQAWSKPWYVRAAALARLPLQVPMITSALKIRRLS